MPNFKKTRGFSLRSGNKPSMSSFKMMGAKAPSPITSPVNMSNFGIGKNTSPLDFKPTGKSKEEIMARQKQLNVKVDGIWGDESKAADNRDNEADAAYYGSEKAKKEMTANPKAEAQAEVASGPTPPGTEPAEKNKGKSLGSKIAAIGVGALTGGLDAVYGSGKILPPTSARLVKSKDDKESEKGSKTAKEILNQPITGFPTDSTKVTA